MSEKNQGDKFPLLIYRRWAKMLRLPALLIAIASGIAWWFAPRHPMLDERSWMFIVIGAVGAVVFLYSILAHQTAYVQCFPSYVRIRTPFLSTAVSYKRILQIRPIEYYSQLPVGKMRRTQTRLLEPFFGYTVILLELNGFPTSERRLRTWLPWFMFAREVTGFVLVVKDWMALSRQISVFSDQWVARRQVRRHPMIGRMH